MLPELSVYCIRKSLSFHQKQAHKERALLPAPVEVFHSFSLNQILCIVEIACL